MLRRVVLAFVAIAGAGGCFDKVEVDASKLECASDQSCPIGYLCVNKQGSPPFGSCVPEGEAKGRDAATPDSNQADVAGDDSNASDSPFRDVAVADGSTSTGGAGAGGSGLGGSSGAGGAPSGGGQAGGDPGSGGSGVTSSGGTNAGGSSGAGGTGPGDASARDVPVARDIVNRDIVNRDTPPDAIGCSLVADGFCSAQCSSSNDVDCRKVDGSQCTAPADCRSGTCTFSTCCGLTKTCPSCSSSTDCTTDPNKPICATGACSACTSNSDCLAKNANLPVCNAKGACVAAPLSWSRLGTGLSGTTVITFAENGSNLYAGTGAGVQLSTDGGVSWTAMNNGFSGLYSNVILSLLPIGSYLLAGTNGAGAFRSANNGSSWTAINNGFISSTQMVHFGVVGPYVVAGLNSGQLARTSNYGDLWEPLPTLPSNSGVTHFLTLGNTLYAATRGSGVCFSTDNGSTWTAITAGLSPEGINGLSDLDVESLAATSSDLVAGTSIGGIYRCPIGGSAWTLSNTGLPPKASTDSLNVPSIVEKGGNLYACQYRAGSGVFLSRDAGKSWEQANYGLPSDVKCSVLYVTGNSILAGTESGIYRSALP